MEELRHREANNTALQAIGPRKKAKLDADVVAAVGFYQLSASLMTLLIVACFFLARGKCQFIAWQHQSNVSFTSTYQASQHARHDLLHGAGEGQLSQYDALQGLSQVINPRCPAVAGSTFVVTFTFSFNLLAQSSGRDDCCAKFTLLVSFIVCHLMMMMMMMMPGKTIEYQPKGVRQFERSLCKSIILQ